MIACFRIPRRKKSTALPGKWQDEGHDGAAIRETHGKVDVGFHLNLGNLNRTVV
jgi:hypothetical protein